MLISGKLYTTAAHQEGRTIDSAESHARDVIAEVIEPNVPYLVADKPLELDIPVPPGMNRAQLINALMGEAYKNSGAFELMAYAGTKAKVSLLIRPPRPAPPPTAPPPVPKSWQDAARARPVPALDGRLAHTHFTWGAGDGPVSASDMAKAIDEELVQPLLVGCLDQHEREITVPLPPGILRSAVRDEVQTLDENGSGEYAFHVLSSGPRNMALVRYMWMNLPRGADQFGGESRPRKKS